MNFKGTKFLKVCQVCALNCGAGAVGERDLWRGGAGEKRGGVGKEWGEEGEDRAKEREAEEGGTPGGCWLERDGGNCVGLGERRGRKVGRRRQEDEEERMGE